MDKVSVIVPICHPSQYLRQTLDSLVYQTLRELEIICVDNGSAGDSSEIVQEYARKDSRIVVIAEPDGGCGKAVNKGLDYAAGDYVGLVEPDDDVDLHMFEELYRIAVKKRLDLVSADFCRFTQDADGHKQTQCVRQDETKSRYRKLLNPSENPDCIRFQTNIRAGIFRRAFLDAHSIRFCETPGAALLDTGFFFQTFVLAQRAEIVNRAYYHARQETPGSFVTDRDKVYCVNIEYDRVRDFLMQDQARWERFQSVYWWKKYHDYQLTYRRIDTAFRQEYLERMRQEYRRAMELGQLSQNAFTAQEWEAVQKLIHQSSNLTDKLQEKTFVHKLLPFIPRSVKRIAVKVLTLFGKIKAKIQNMICS